MLLTKLVNDIRNEVQVESYKIPFVQFHHCNAYIGEFLTVTIGDTDYTVRPIKSYNTIVGFVYNGILYEVGKYSRTTSKQITQIHNQIFPDTDRKYVDCLYS